MNAELRSEPASEFRLLINGRLVPGAATFDVVNPATEEVVAACPRADRRQLDQAVAAAKAAFPAWARRPIAERRKLIEQFAAELEKQSLDFARLLTREQGKPLPQAAFELAGAVGMIRTWAPMELPTEVLRETDTTRIVRQRTPLGVVAAITPWNFPVHLLMLKLPPALLAGNTVVVKPAPTTPLSTLKLGEICARVFPPGVVNIIADENDLGPFLTSHPDVAKIAFTGSTATGKKVLASTAGTLKRLTLELGGNDPAIVLDDADPAVVAPKIFRGAMANAGQICLAIKRVYAHESIYDRLCEELAALARRTVVGDGEEEGVEMGPLQNRMQYEKVKGFLAEARERGKVIAGGRALERRGYFIPPTIVRDIPDDARLVREEQFGPVLPVLRYTDLDDAIARANDSEYGLGATVWSSNLERAYAVALRIESGTVWVNKHLELPHDLPFGGAKQSGLGTEMGQEGLEEFTQAKMVNIAK
ncbi:MAG: aldehyde dehydrogenase family protein [Steroidobacteraceae bacterium]